MIDQVRILSLNNGEHPLLKKRASKEKEPIPNPQVSEKNNLCLELPHDFLNQPGLYCSIGLCQNIAIFKCQHQILDFQGCGNAVCSSHSTPIIEIRPQQVSPEELPQTHQTNNILLAMPGYAAVDFHVVNKEVEIYRSCNDCFPRLLIEYKRKRRKQTMIETAVILAVLAVMVGIIVWLLQKARVSTENS
jgi:predicted nucleic acid-binding Zn ribbon protein